MEGLEDIVLELVNMPFLDLIGLCASWIGVFTFGFCFIHFVIWAVVRLWQMFKNISSV